MPLDRVFGTSARGPRRGGDRCRGRSCARVRLSRPSQRKPFREAVSLHRVRCAARGVQQPVPVEWPRVGNPDSACCVTRRNPLRTKHQLGRMR